MDSTISTSAAGGVIPGVSVIGTSLDNDAGFISVVNSAEQAVKITNKIINPLVIFSIELLLLWFPGDLTFHDLIFDPAISLFHPSHRLDQ